MRSCYMKDMHVFERDVNGRRYRIAAQSVWDPVRSRSWRVRPCWDRQQRRRSLIWLPLEP